jgi:hypothetical protein
MSLARVSTRPLGATSPPAPVTSSTQQLDHGPDLAPICLEVLRTTASLEAEPAADMNCAKPASGEFDLRTRQFRRAPDPPVEILRQVLMHEFRPLVRSSSRFNYVIPHGPGLPTRFAPCTPLRTNSTSSTGSLRPLTTTWCPFTAELPAALDYLSLVLASILPGRSGNHSSVTPTSTPLPRSCIQPRPAPSSTNSAATSGTSSANCVSRPLPTRIASVRAGSRSPRRRSTVWLFGSRRSSDQMSTTQPVRRQSG